MHNKLESIDLNLLTALRVLLTQSSVSRAANALNITQSGMSRNLSRLRSIFGDELLVRVGNHLEMTPFAETLVPRVENACTEVARVFQSAEFRPLRMSGTFAIAAPDFFSQIALPDLYDDMCRQAPLVRLNVVNWHADTLNDLVRGDLDLALGAVDHAPADVHQRLVLKSDFVCIANPDYYAGRELDVAAYVNARHVVVGMEGKGDTPIDVKLASLGLQRDVCLRVPQFSAAFELASRTSLMLTTSRTLARVLKPHYRFIEMEPPFNVEFAPLSLYWHRRHRHDPGHQWLRDTICQAVQRHGSEVE